MTNLIISISSVAGWLTLSPSMQATWNSAVSVIIKGVLQRLWPSAKLHLVAFHVMPEGDGLCLSRVDLSKPLDAWLCYQFNLGTSDICVNDEGMVFNLKFYSMDFHGESTELPFGKLSIAYDGNYVFVHANGSRQEGALSELS